MQDFTRAILTTVKLYKIAVCCCLTLAIEGITIVRKVRNQSSTDTVPAAKRRVLSNTAARTSNLEDSGNGV